MARPKNMTLEQAKRIYKTWKHHPDMIVEAKQATKVIDQYVELVKRMKKLYEKELNWECETKNKTRRKTKDAK